MKRQVTDWKKRFAIVSSWFLTKAPKTYDGEKTASSTNVAEKIGYMHTENNSKWIKDLNIRLETLKLVQ
jgi:hypothetical protein